MKRKTKIILLILILIILITIGAIYLLYEASLYSTLIFTVSNIYDNSLEVSRIEKMPIINKNNDLIIGEVKRIYRINLDDVEIKDANNKRINLTELKEGDRIEVIKRTDPTAITEGNSGEVTYLSGVISIKDLDAISHNGT